jgi:predicted lysophospholipase L1 biosynthesis ABC-type transport system permease subunit
VLVVDQEALLALAPPDAIDSLDAQLWSARDADTVTRAAQSAGLTVRLDTTADEMRASHATLVARSWVTRYLQAFTVLALVLGLLVLAGLQRRDREQRRLQDRTLADLGHPRRLVSRAAGAALAVVALLGAVAGGVAAYAVTSSLADRLDPEPDLQPALVVTGTGQLLLAAVAFGAVALVLTLVGGAAEHWLGRTRSVNELLHDE